MTPDGDVWVANSGNRSVSRLRNNGTFVAEIGVGQQPTGVAVDAAGKVWASNLSSNTASRINPATNSVDLTVSLGAGAEPYNYSDMTGATLTGAPDTGTWTAVYDSRAADTPWAYADWSATLPGDSAVEVFVASSADGVTFGPEVRLVDGLAPEGLADGRYLQVKVRFTRSSAGESPSLQDLTLAHVGDRASTLSYQWRPVAAAGPPVFLSSPTSAQPSFVAPDDGKYTFEVTVTDSAGQTDTDRVTVTVTNADPDMQVTAGPASERGVTLVHGKFTDPGWVDTHTATFDWGDGSSPDRVPVSTQGPGWGTFLGSHVYSSAGSYQVKVTLRDDDGGEVAQVVDQLRVEKPVAVWANSTSLTDSLSWSGSEGSIEGRVHTNGQLRFIGATKTVTGATTYAGTISADTTKNSFDPAPVTAPVQDFPVIYEIADYRPDGPVAREIGASYRDMTSACSSGSWHEVAAPLPSGVYYADCPIMLNGSDIGGYVTLVSESTIKIAGSRPAFEPYLDGLLALSGASGAKAIEIATSTSKFLGVLFAGSGEISISGSKNRFFCGVLGDRVEITGGDTRIRGAACGRPDATVSGPVVVPDLAASLTVDKAEALPSQTLGYDLKVTNRGSTLIVPAVIGLENVDTLTETVTGYDFALERLDLASGEWVPLAANGDDGLRIELHPNAFTGVTYPENGGIAGTTAAPGGWATWGLEAVLWLDPARTKALLDPEVTGGIRTRVEFELTPSGAQARRLFTHGDNFIDGLRAQSADVTDATATLLLPSGEANSIGPDAEPGFAGLTPGSSVTLHSTWAVPVAAARAAGESDNGYLARLRGLDGSNLTGGAFVVATGGVGRLVAPLSTVSTTRTLPVVKPTTTGPTAIPSGATSGYELKVANVGSRQAEDVELVATASGETLTVAGAPTALAAGELATATTQVTIAKDNPPADVDVTGVVTWADAAGNSYGPIASTYSSGVLQPALLTATLADTLQTDVNGDGQVSPGDTLRYTLTATNHGGQSIDDVTATVTPDPESALAVGSIETSAGTVSSGNTPGDTSVDVNLGALQGQSTAQVSFDVVVRDPFPAGTTALQVQGQVTATGHDPVITDDPARPGLTDPTRTAVVAPVPNLGAYLSVRHHLDPDGNGKPSPGDTLRYQPEVHSIGSEAVTDIGVNVPIPAAATLNTDSLTSTQGSTSHTGDSLTATLGTLHPFTTATVKFDLRIADPVPAGTTAVAVQGTVSSTELADQLTDDPDTFMSGDPTQTSITDTVEPGEGDTTSGDGPAVTGFAPAEGAVVTAPTPVAVGSVTPVEGTTVEGWKLTLREQGASTDTAQMLASGTGAPPTQDTMTMTAAIPSAVTGPEALATLDPTTMPNGIWVLQLVLVDSAGGRTSTQVAVVVDGQLKLGDAELAYLDMAIPVGGIPIQLQRRYRSIDRQRDGDLGHGWSLDAANFRVQVNRPLGAGGWEQYGCGSGLIFVPLCYRTSKPHFVTVTWPNGRTETFDFTPGPGNTFFSMAVPTAYTGRRGTTSKLEPAPDDLGASWLGDGNLYGGAFGGDGLYDPQQFVLVAADGTRYLLDRSSGLVQATDRTGNTVTVTEDGITSSAGPSVSYHRNAEGRIDRIDGPAGLTVSYDYDANGDLVSVTDANGHVHRYGYQDHLLTTSDEPGAGPFQTLTYENGRLVSVDDGVNPPQTFDVDLGARTETAVSPDLKETVVTTFDERGNPVEVDRVFDGEHHKTTFEYNDFDFVTLRQDPTGRTWRAEYDDQGHLASLQDARGKTTTFEEYTDFGVPRTITDELGHTTRLTFDPETADLLSIQDPLGHSRSWTYNPDGTVATYRDGSVKPDGTPREWSYTYEGGQVATEKDPGNHVTTYEHNAAGQLKAEIDATGVRTEYEYDDVGNLWLVKLPLGRTTEYRYDERDRLTDVFDGERRNTHYRYNDVGLLWKEERGNPDNGERDTLTYTYTPRDQVATILNSAGDLLTYGYDGGGRLISVEDGEHRVTEYGYDLADRVVSTQYPNGSTDTWGYDENGRLNSVTDTLGGETVIGRDDSGRVTSVSDPMQHTTGYKYDEAGRIRFVTDPLNHVTEYRYDQAGRLTAEINPLKESTEYAYGPAGRLSSIKDGEGRQTHYGYDDAGRPNRVTDALNRTASTSYDDGGWPQVHTTATGVSSTLAWDQAGLLKSVTDELNHTTTWNYDSVGRLEQRINARGFTTTWKYDPAGRVEREIDARGGTVEFGYDHAGQLTSITNPNSKVTLIGYDALGNIDEFSNPLGKTWSWTYDPLGRLDISTDPKNQQVDWDYDPASRPDQTKTPDGVIDYTYDDADRLTSVADPTGTVSWAYDDADRPKLVTAPAGAVGYEYDQSGLLTAMQLPQGTVTRSYDPTGGLDKVTDWTDAWTDYDVNGDGQPDKVTRSNGVTTDYGYDDAGRLDHLSHTGAAGLIEEFGYDLDENGNRVGERSASGTTSYTLDELDRLTKAVYPSGKTVDYTYYADGSRKTRTVGQKTTEYTYDDAGQLVTAVGPDRTIEYGYDANGNLETAGSDRYGYDWANRMVSASLDGVDHSWVYDGQGIRVEADGVPQLWDRTVDNPAGVEYLVGAGDTAFVQNPFGGLSTSIENGSTTWALGTRSDRPAR